MPIIKRKYDIMAMALMVVLCFSGVSLPWYRYHTFILAICVGVVMFVLNRSWGFPGLSDTGKLFRRPGVWALICLPVLLNLFAAPITALAMPQYYSFILGYEPTRTFISQYSNYKALVIAIAAMDVAWRGYFQTTLLKWFKNRAALAILVPAAILPVGLISVGANFNSLPFDTIAWDYAFMFVNCGLYGLLFYRTKSLPVTVFTHIIAVVISHWYGFSATIIH